tara:strand:- start:30 stop:320 length:291 start_codon:yes stop_codon:yes gene_type:complete
MESIDGYQKIGFIKPIVGQKYYYFKEIHREGEKVELTTPIIGEYVRDDRLYRDYEKLVFKVDGKDVDVWYGMEAGTLYLKEYIEDDEKEGINCAIS